MAHRAAEALGNGARPIYPTIKQYGLMAKPVLNRWNIHQCEDFGQMVFALVNAGLMHKTEEDSVEDFAGVFDFDEAFLPALQLSEII